jgi:hypothetical protein
MNRFTLNIWLNNEGGPSGPCCNIKTHKAKDKNKEGLGGINR